MSNNELKHYGVKGMKWRKHKTKAKQALDEYHEAKADADRYAKNAALYEEKRWDYANGKRFGSPEYRVELRNYYNNKRTAAMNNSNNAAFRAESAARKWKKYAEREQNRLTRKNQLKGVVRKANQLRVAGKKKMAKLKSQMAKSSLKEQLATEDGRSIKQMGKTFLSGLRDQLTVVKPGVTYDEPRIEKTSH